MPKLIEARAGHYLDANLVYEVVAMEKTVIVVMGREPTKDKRIQFGCSNNEEAAQLAAKIVKDVNEATELPFLPSTLGRFTGEASVMPLSGQADQLCEPAPPGPPPQKPEQGQKKK